MSMTLALVIAVILVAVAFDYTNGFHDAANAIATCVSTRALRPRAALAMAAVMNLVGALMGTAVAETIATKIIDVGHYTASDDPSMQAHGLVIILGALLGAIGWNLITWWFGLPSSSSHALIGGLAGAGLVAGLQVYWMDGIVGHVIVPMIVSPLVGFGLAYLLTSIMLRLLRNFPYHRTMRTFRTLQIFSSAAMALGHGLQDAQKTMGIMFMALMVGGHYSREDGIPFWVKLLAAGAIAAGTYSGGWRIMRTLGRKMIKVTPAHGFMAEAVSAGVLYMTAFLWHAPISTTHTVTTAIMGVGATKRLSAVRWGMAGNIVIAWILTLPAAGLMAAICYLAVHLVFPY